MKKSLILITLILTALTAFSLTNFEKHISNAKIYYDNGEFDKVIAELKEALGIAEKDNHKGMIEAMQYLAFSYVAYDNYEKAEQLFTDILKIDSGFALDRDTTSPKILGVYDKAKAASIMNKAKEEKIKKEEEAKKAAELKRKEEEAEAKRLVEEKRLAEEKAAKRATDPYDLGLTKEKTEKKAEEKKKEEKKVVKVEEKKDKEPSKWDKFDVGFRKKEKTEEEIKEEKKDKEEKGEKEKKDKVDWDNFGY